MSLRVAIAGATGAVGIEFLKLFKKRNFAVSELRLLASPRSAGKKIVFGYTEITIETLTHDSFENIDLAFFSAGGDRSLEFAPSAVKAGALVIDNSSVYRLDKDVPLVVRECNPKDALNHNGIIANPNCSTIAMAVTLKPLHDAAQIKRVVVSTYQAVSGSGAAALVEMEEQVKAYAQNKLLAHHIYPAQILFNVIPQVDVFQKNGYTKEEMKMTYETRKIFHAPEMAITATCVRVPVMRCHSESINVETEKKLSVAQATELFQNADNIIVNDTQTPGGYPMPIEGAEKFETFVGRIREDISVKNGLAYWCVSDQLYKGAALNSLQIAEYLLEQGQL